MSAAESPLFADAGKRWRNTLHALPVNEVYRRSRSWILKDTWQADR
jgi:hypothetical protein